jgi:hypothetical protein
MPPENFVSQPTLSCESAVFNPDFLDFREVYIRKGQFCEY